MTSDHGYYATGYPVDATRPAPTPEAPFTEPGEHAENLDRGIVEPTSTADARKFSAPFMEWDATRYDSVYHPKDLN